MASSSGTSPEARVDTGYVHTKDGDSYALSQYRPNGRFTRGLHENMTSPSDLVQDRTGTPGIAILRVNDVSIDQDFL
jgi:hypothetical protein